MKFNLSKVMFGIAAFIVGLLLIGSAFDIISIKDVYPFWTLFIIIPTIASMVTNGINLWKTALLAFGVNCLICQIFWDVWGWRQFLTINTAVIFILLGIYLVFGDLKKNGIINRNKNTATPPTDGTEGYYGNGGESDTENFGNGYNNNNQYNYNYNYTAGAQQQSSGNPKASGSYNNSDTYFDSNPHPVYSAVLASKRFGNNCTAFRGANVTATMGSLNLDLSNITLQNDAQVVVTSIMGNIDIFVPNNVRVEANGTEVLGSCNSYAPNTYVENAPCLRIKYTVVLGGIDIKAR